MQLAAGATAQCALVLLAHPARPAVRDRRCRCVFVVEFHTVLSLLVSMQLRCQYCPPGPHRADSLTHGAPGCEVLCSVSSGGSCHPCCPGCSRRARMLECRPQGPPFCMQHESDCIGAPAPTHPEVVLHAAALPLSMSIAAVHQPISWFNTLPAIGRGRLTTTTSDSLVEVLIGWSTLAIDMLRCAPYSPTSGWLGARTAKQPDSCRQQG